MMYHKNVVSYFFIIFYFLSLSCTSKNEIKSTLPNVVFILADDIGQGDVGFYHTERTGEEPVIPTPNLDRLITSGIRFNDAHTVSALCSPTRYSVMTGNYTFRCYKPWGVWNACAKSAVGEGQITVGQVMKNAGYKTAFFGKWHLGGDWHVKGSNEIYKGVGTGDETTDFTEIVDDSPNHLGFDYSFMLPSGIQNNPFAFYENANWMPLGDDSEFIINPLLHGGFHKRKHPRFADSNWKTSEAGRQLTQKTIDFIDNHVSENPEQPFFIYYCSQAVHVPHEPPVEFFGEKVAETTISAHGDMIKELDLQVGKIVEVLKEKGQYENTLIIFSSDNGGLQMNNTEETGHDSSNGFRGSKTWIYEGGHRVPFIASWPEKINSNQVSNEPVMVHDLAATLYSLTDQDMPENQAMDSYNILPLLLQEQDAKGRDVIFSQGSGGRANLAIRKGDWKLIIKSDRDDPGVRIPIELYNLSENEYENEELNLIDDPGQKDRVEELLQLYNQIRDSKKRTTERVQSDVILNTPPEVSKEMWYQIDTEDDFSPSILDAHDWLDSPAGKHGFVVQKDDHFEFENGTPVKFWGVNIAERRSFPPREESDRYVKYYQKYGVNAVRFHKFTWALTENMQKSVFPDSIKFDKLDYLSAKLKEKGIYYGWSHIYGHRVLPGDSSRLLAYGEVKNIGGGHLKGSTYNLVYFAPDLQDLSIGLTVNMLNHVNPYTGMKYADDPALCFVELNNEDNLFFASAHSRIMQAPTYKKLIEGMFSNWLLEKYGSHDALVDAWDKEALNAFPEASNNEHLDLKNIYPMAHHGYLSTKYLKENPQLKKRIWDTARFLYETQNEFYNKFVEAVRETGYKGPIVPSGWQAGDNIAHLYNLHSDYLFGFIDRHNYYGGSRAGHLAMVDQPGMGLLSSGMQQVKDKPFALSEWISVMPNEWLTEAAPLIAVYGMGLQGWDASYSYASNHPFISNSLHSKRHGVYNADAPVHMGLYPALSRMVYRGDVAEGDIISTRNVHIPSLIKGNIGFEERITQIYDVKEFTGTVPREALAIGRTVIDFTDEFKETKVPDFSDYWNKKENVIVSETGQLNWHYNNRGFITVNTPGTVGFIGFPPDSTFNIGNYIFNTSNKFAVVLITSLEKSKKLQDAKRILVSTFARAENTGMKHNESSTDYIERGTEPILMEPVNIAISFPGIKSSILHVLDFQGQKINKQIDASNNQFMLNGSQYKTNYYLLER